MIQRVCFGFVLLCLLTTSANAAKNVLLLVTDNQNKDDCGCYGNDVIQTPNIDRLAKQGTKFADAFATTASCGPSRAVIYSGIQTHANGQYGHGHGIHTFNLLPKVQTVFKLLGDSGYHTALLGKRGTSPASSYPLTFEKNVSGRDLARMTKLADEFIREAGDEPFCLTIGFSDPHPTSRDRPGWGVDPKHAVEGLRTYSPDEVIIPRYLPDRPEVREGLAGYYQEIMQLDHGVGNFLDLLEKHGKADETLVIFTSDHGSSEPGAMGNHYEPGIQIPLIVRCPTVKEQGTTNPALVTLADITPTILDWTGTRPPEYPLHGRSFLPPLVGETDGWDEVFLSHVCHEVPMYYPMRTFRNRQYKLIWNVNWRSEFPNPIDTLSRATWTEAIRRGELMMGRRTIEKFLFRDQIEIYDLKNDPDEIINLADQPQHADLRRAMTAKLMGWLKETEDQWLVRHRPTLPGESLRTASMQANFAEDSEYQPLFNGKNLDGWILRRADRGGYKVEDGKIVCPADGGGYLFTESEYDDFSFRFDFKLSKAANNGIAIRSPLIDGKPAYEGMEFQILDNVGYPKKLKPTQYHGSLYDVVGAIRGALRPVGQWNDQEIRCYGNRITVILNGVAILDTDLSEISDAEVIKKHPGLKRKSGHIGLLGHGSRVEFRNLRVKQL